MHAELVFGRRLSLSILWAGCAVTVACAARSRSQPMASSASNRAVPQVADAAARAPRTLARVCTLEDAVSKIVGTNARNCASADSAVEARCFDEAFSDGRSAYVVETARARDAFRWQSARARDKEGTLHIVRWESDTDGPGATVTAERLSCSGAFIDPNQTCRSLGEEETVCEPAPVSGSPPTVPLSKPCSVARHKIEEAVYNQYLQGSYDLRIDTIRGVIAAADQHHCPAWLLAYAWMNLGLVEGSALLDLEGAKKHFARALALDPNAHLDDALATPAVKRVFEEVQAAARKR